MTSEYADVYAVVLAGGSGTRFWPKSRHKKPKQLCALGNTDETMLETTLHRLDGFIPPERRIIVTHVDQAEATKRVAKGLCHHVVPEPEARNTANAVALGAFEIKALAGRQAHPIMLSLHADALIKKVPEFLACAKTSIAVARKGNLTLFGIVPKYPETGYGYIERGGKLDGSFEGRAGYSVASFREKPELAVATEYVKSGRFYWNAGIFCWPVDLFLGELSSSQPEIVEALDKLLSKHSGCVCEFPFEKLRQTYCGLPKISVDHAVLERSKRVAMVEADIDWQDVGSWDALSETFPVDAKGNLALGDALLIDCEGTTVDTDGPLAAAVGLKDMVVVCSGGAILVCPKSKAQEVKRIVDTLKEKGRKEYL